MKIEDLNQIYSEAESCDQEILAEMRSNVLLVSGDHYTRRYSALLNNRLRENMNIPENTRIRLTRNHTRKIVHEYVNNIVSFAPGVFMKPAQPGEQQDQKAAEMHNSVWVDAKKKYKLDAKIKGFANDFCEIGECHAYIYWDANKGKLLGYRPEMLPDGTPSMDENGQPVVDKRMPVHSGDFCIEKIYGFNIRRSPEAETFEDSQYLIVNRMGLIKDLKKIYAGDEDKLNYIQTSMARTFRIFDAVTGNYRPADPTEVLLRYYYFRPTLDMPMGRYYIATEFGILEEDDLPFGVFPIESACFEEIATTPRGRSIIKQIRPYQAEINRKASKIAEHQITLGDDKLIFQGAAKVSSGAHLPGIRIIQAAGAAPTVVQGRAGDQYVNSMLQDIEEMYKVADLELDSAEKGQIDPFTLLFQSASQRKKFIRYSSRFEDFLVRFAKLFLTLAKRYYSEDMVIQAVGKKEIVNISEFKNANDLNYEITVEPANDDLETRMGQQIILSQALQYVGSNLPPGMIGQILKAMPYANFEQVFGDMTLSYDTARNVMLALERGEQPIPNKYDEAPYMIQKLTARVRQADFPYLAPEIQQNYESLIAAYEEMEAEKQRQLVMAQSQLIPMDGPRAKADIYINDPSNPSKVVRATFPQKSLQWLMERLDMQGLVMDANSELPSGAQADIANMVTRQAPPPAFPMGIPPEG